MENEWLNNKDRVWLRNAPNGKLKGTLEAPNGQKDNQSLEEFCERHEEDITKLGKFLAISGVIKRNALHGKVGRHKLIDLKESTSMLYSRPGLYIVRQKVPSQLGNWKKPRTHYVGEGKNLAQRIKNRGGKRSKIFSDGSEVTIIIKREGTINQDQFFIHEVRLTCERMISDLIEEKWPEKAACCNKPSWCLIHKEGVKQVGELELFVRHLLKNKIISPP